jgi:phage gp29-like protein
MPILTLIDRIREAARAFAGKSAGGDMQSVKIAALAKESFDNLAKNITPKKLRTILDSADAGDILDQHRLFADAEDSDEHLFTELSKRRRALLSLDWKIMPAVTADAGMRKKAEEYAEIVSALFDSIPDFEDTIFDLSDGIGHGFSALEIEWGMDGTFHVPQALHYRPQTYFMLSPEERELRLRSEGERDGIPLLPLGWIIHRHKSKSGWLPRYGLFRVVMAAWLLKSYSRNGFAEFLEIHGLPLRLAKYPISSSEQEKKDLLRGMVALGRDAAAIIPSGMEVEFVAAAKASESPFATMVDHCEMGLSKAILGGTLTTQADGRTSTNALGVIHEEVRHDLLVSDAVQLASTLTKQLLLPLAVLNCNLDDPKLAPWFRFDTAEAEDLLQLAEAIPKLTPVMRIPAKWAHEKTRIPMPEEGEEVLEMRAGAGPAGPEDEADEPGEPEEKKKPAPAKKAPKDKETEAGAKADAPDPLNRLNCQISQFSSRQKIDAPDPAQDALDAAMDAVSGELQAHMETMLAPLMAEVRDGLPPDELMARLGALYPALDTAALEEHMARVLFVSELWGRVNGQR